MSAPTRDQMEFANAVRALTLLALVALLMYGCSAQDDIRTIRRDVDAMRGTLNDVRRQTLGIESDTDRMRQSLLRMEWGR